MKLSKKQIREIKDIQVKLIRFFVWEDTPQGHRYWEEVKDNLQSLIMSAEDLTQEEKILCDSCYEFILKEDSRMCLRTSKIFCGEEDCIKRYFLQNTTIPLRG